MSEGAGGDRTEEATPRRREQAREKGQVARSQEVSSTAVLVGGCLVLLSSLPWMGARLQDMAGLCLGNLGGISLEGGGDAAVFVRRILTDSALIVAPVVAAVFVVGTAAAAAQVGWHISPAALAFRLEKLNPVEGAKKFFSPNALFELVKNLLKVGLLGVVGWWTLRQQLPRALDVVLLPTLVGWQEVVGLVATLVLRMMLVLALLSAADWFWQKHRHEKQLKMTRQEVKQENRDTDGDPQVRARLREIQLRRFLKRMMAQVPQADVVVTNPTHYAVALRYRVREGAPKVVAKGKNHVAFRIRDLAAEHGIPVVENKPLAQALYRTVEVDGFVPVDLYQAVAEVLAQVYRTGRRAGQAHEGAPS